MKEPRRTILIREISPDGKLVLVAERFVEQSGEVAVSVGFEGHPWHVHPESLKLCAGLPAEQGALELVQAVLADRMIVISRTSPEFNSVAIAGTLEDEIGFLHPDEKVSFRMWSGPVVHLDQLIDGTVKYLPLG